ncbi:MAG: ROK family protein [Actinomycetaceae bacterium]|nr:ROK family protein [Actinomycetaceae bacterium]MDU0970209.1 ROK family protein [Actinomycetaceae bacterium]
MARLLDDSLCAFAAEVISRGPQARTELSQRLTLSAASMTRLQRELLARDVLAEGHPEPNAHATGRPTHVLVPSPTPRTFVGVKLTSDHLYAVSTSLTCERQDTVDAPLTGRSPQAVMRQVADTVARLAPAPQYVGISMGGTVDSAGHVGEAVYLGWRDVDLAPWLAEAGCAVPAVFLNDVEGVARYEQWFGMGRVCEDFSVVTIGTGVGHAVIHHGRVLHRGDNLLGLIGHLPLDAGSPRTCWLGHSGCAAALLNLDAIVTAVRDAAPGKALPPLDPAAPGPVPEVAWLRRCLDEDVPRTRRVLEDAYRDLARLLAIIADVSVAQALTITGELAGILTWGLGDIDAMIAQLRDPVSQPIEITLRPDTFDFWAQGAAAAAIRQWLLATLAA